MAGGVYTIYGLRASYFTQKALGIFSFKQIPFTFRSKTLAVRSRVEARVGTHMIPVVVSPDDHWQWDTTPIAFDLDRKFPDTPIIPDPASRPVLYAAMRVLEDYFDEWLTRQAIFYRWHHDADRTQAANMLAREIVGVEPGLRAGPIQFLKIVAVRRKITQWAMRTCRRAAADERNRAAITTRFDTLMQLLNQHLATSAFLLGPRPSLADFALFGALEAHFLLDPTPRHRIETSAPAVAAYRQRVRHARSGEVGDWPDDELPPALWPLLEFVGHDFHGFLSANRAAIRTGVKFVDLDMGFGPVRLRTRHYSEKTRKDTAAALAAMANAGRVKTESALGPLGCLDVYSLDAS